ncbi:MAG: type II secretion system F family protein [Phycisphaerales bacterium JB065]
MRFAYEAFKASGSKTDGSIEATSAAEATELLRHQGLFVTAIREAAMIQSSGEDQKSGGFKLSLGSNRIANIAMFTRQLSILVSTGTPLVDALEAVERQIRDERWKKVVTEVREQVEEGSPLSEAMADHPGSFDTIAISLIHAGETGGKLEVMLERLSRLTRQRQKLRSAILGAMVYPSLLICVSVGVLSLMIGFVLPRFAEMFESLDTPLPATTQMLMGLSDFARGNWPVLIVGVLAVIAGIIFVLKSPAGQIWLDRTMVNAPLFGKLVRSFHIAQTTRLLGVLVQSQVPLLDALELTRKSTKSHCYANLIERAENAVTKGDSISTIFCNSDLVPISVSEAVRNGEQSGRVGEVLLGVSDFLDEDNEVVMRSLTSIIEPIILIVLGLLVGFVAISMFLPLFDLSSAAQGGPSA